MSAKKERYVPTRGDQYIAVVILVAAIVFLVFYLSILFIGPHIALDMFIPVMTIGGALIVLALVIKSRTERGTYVPYPSD